MLKARLHGCDQPQVDAVLQSKKDEYAALLRKGVWRINFVKVDGTQSVMEGTLDPQFLPPGDITPTDKPTQSSPSALRVYAVDRDGWRSFKVLNVLNITEIL